MTQHHELSLEKVIRGERVRLYDFFIIPGHRSRRWIIDGYIHPGNHTGAVTGDFRTVKEAQDWFEERTGERPPRWRKSLKLGQNMIDKLAAKNPKPFGKRKAKHVAFKRVAPKKSAPKFGKRKLALSEARRQGRTVHAIAAYEKGKNGEQWYFNGVALDSNRQHAAIYTDWRQAERVLAAIENRVPANVRAISVIAVNWL